MFRDLKRTLRQLDGTHNVPVSVEVDDDGYFDRQCHKPDCMFLFKVHLEDWIEKVGEEAVFPFCGHSANSAEWSTQEQTEHHRSIAAAHFGNPIGQALKRDANRWNRTQPGNRFIKITMHLEGRPLQVSLPPAAAEPMRLKVECTACDCRYAVIGAAFFCPSCGHSDAGVVFHQTLSGIRGSIGALGDVRVAIADPDTAENMVRSIIENGLQKTVTAFQRYLEALYARAEPRATPRRNVFQNVSSGSALWCSATGIQYSDHLTTAEFDTLRRAFQQRHLLAHTQGIVDQDYIYLSGDTSHDVGERLVIGEAAVLNFLDVVEKLAVNLRVSVA